MRGEIYIIAIALVFATITLIEWMLPEEKAADAKPSRGGDSAGADRQGSDTHSNRPSIALGETDI